MSDRLTPVAEKIVGLLMNDPEIGKLVEELTLEVTDVTAERLEGLSNADNEHPIVQLYYANQSHLYIKALMEAAQLMVNYNDLSRVPVYKLLAHVSEYMFTLDLGKKVRITFKTGSGNSVRHGFLKKIDGPRNQLWFSVSEDSNDGHFTVKHCDIIDFTKLER